MIDKLPKMNRIEMVRCEVTGKLFPASECEIVIIKIIKSKASNINSYNPLPVVAKEVIIEKAKEYADNPTKNLEIFTNISPTFPAWLKNESTIINATKNIKIAFIIRFV